MNKKKEFLFDFFTNLNEEGIRYVLLRNIDQELPDNYRVGMKDIDLLVHPDDKSKFHAFMKKHKFVSCPHPLDKGAGIVYLYAVTPFEFYKKQGFYFDVCYQMVCKSPNAGEYMPVDMLINSSVWGNRIISDEYPWYVLSDEDLMIHLLTRCVFDKGRFELGYISKLNELNNKVDKDVLKRKLETVFFKFTTVLLDKIESRSYDEIVDLYFSFINY